MSFREWVHGCNRRWHVFTGNARQQGLAVSHDAARSDAKDPRERDQRECKSLSRLNQARLCSGSFGVCARGIGAWSQLVVYQRLNGPPEHIAPIEVGFRRGDSTLRCENAEERRGNGALDIEARECFARSREGES